MKSFLSGVTAGCGVILVMAGIYGFIHTLPLWGAPIVLGGIAMLASRAILD